jgi:murein DD-endopeptidase MepM/ murein hydrolase activator NlpD
VTEAYQVKSVHTPYTSYPKYDIKNEPFSWPIKGYIVTPFGISGGSRSKGIDIRSGEGASVRAAKSGRVVYCDPHLKGFGKTVIIDHGGGLQTVYAYNSEILVKVGDAVERGTVIAKAGSTGRAKEPSVHFEVRKNGEPQNPAYYLP